ncbi:MAG: DEAD/DEAH box helicase family protein [bacterium]
MTLPVNSTEGSVFFSGPQNILERNIAFSSQNTCLTSTQSQVDGMVEGFLQQATDFKSLAAMMVGGLAYRAGRIGTLSVGAQDFARIPMGALLQKVFSIGIGLAAEVSAFEFTNRFLSSVQSSRSKVSSQPATLGLGPETNLWSWSGPGGLKEGLLQSFITFSTLKFAGWITPGQNLILQHGIQDLAMVAGHQFVYRVGIGNKPEGSFAEQLLHAEATNLQLMAGMALGHGITGGRFYSIEKGLDLSLGTRDVGDKFPRPGWTGEETSQFRPAFVFAAKRMFSAHLREESDSPASSKNGRSPNRLDSLFGPEIVMMAAAEGSQGAPVGDLRFIREEEGGAWKIEGLEENRIGAQALIRQASEEVSELKERLKLLAEASAELLRRWEREIKRLEKRSTFWEEEIQASETKPHQDQARHVQDITIGIRLHLGRMNRLGAELHAYPIPEEPFPEVGLRSPRPIRIVTPGTRLSDIYQGLKNYDVGFGETLSFRPHQIESLKQIEGWLKRHRRKFESRRDLPAEQQELMQGTIVMPVGGGKTRTMMGAFALAMDHGLFRPGKDKFLILNHTEEIHRQNLKVTELLGEFFQKKFNRPLKVTEYKADERDLSGDVVVISIPTTSGTERRERLAHDLLRALGPEGKISMAAVDEVHHLGLGIKTGKDTWPELMKTLRKVSPSFYRLGFTATPTGHEGAVFSKVSAMELMKAGVTPRTYLVKTPGIDLTDVAIRGGEFSPAELERTLLSEENRRRRNFPSTRPWNNTGSDDLNPRTAAGSA